MIQGFAVALKTGALTKEVLDDTVGIHPTCAESMCNLQDLKQEGVELDVSIFVVASWSCWYMDLY